MPFVEDRPSVFRIYGGRLWTEKPRLKPWESKSMPVATLRRSLAQNWAQLDLKKPFEAIPLEGCSAGVQRQARAVPSLRDEYMVIDDILHQRSTGPIFVSKWRHGTEAQDFFAIDFTSWHSDLRYFHLMLGALQPRRIAEMTRSYLPYARFDREVDIKRDDVAPDPLIIRGSAERALWNFLWRAQHRTEGVDRRVVEDVRDVRRYLERRWPRETFDYTFPDPKRTATHLFRPELPDIADMMPLLDRIVATSDLVWGSKTSGTYAIVRDLALEHVMAAPNQPVDELADLKL